MKRPLIITVAVLAVGTLGAFVSTGLLPVAAQPAAMQVAAAQTTTFAIQNMTCALCPVTVRKAMEGVAGVRSVTVDFDAKTATVVFDPSVTNAAAIAAASTNAGYPAAVKA
ncbi:heavy-metal-associated domain-containing protein [Sphingosinicella soli]|uniref:Mercuric ion binding protein n=1 Tax=Sphingosinicella soli TaxID=333708 RepID=A0A7W7AYI2_9SPHN|nr:heavy metal-associated domain-containing protein [Sphingosinicella soli]MBB4630731.1 mercuric ion binding protein [Sphingosinicella soli]